MLKRIDPLLTGTLLHHLQDMGHGDVLALVDRNFPAAATSKRLVELPGTTVPQVATAILTLFPIDEFVEPAILRMGQVGNEQQVLDVHAAFQQAVDAAEGRTRTVAPLDRFAFYEQARNAYLTVATSEERPYGCFLIVKGVV